jgi:hypothetical protein
LFFHCFCQFARRAIISASLVAPAPMTLDWINTTRFFFALDEAAFHLFAYEFAHILVGFFTP